jgi:hypothetical protein
MTDYKKIDYKKIDYKKIDYRKIDYKNGVLLKIFFAKSFIF